MRKLIITLSAVMAFVGQIAAQTLHLSLEFPTAEAAQETKLFVSPMEGEYNSSAEMVLSGNKFEANVTTSKYKFYSVMGVRKNAQVMLPLYIAATEGNASVKMDVDDNIVVAKGDIDNTYLSDLNVAFAKRDRQLWSGKATLDEAKAMFADYSSPVKTTANADKISADVKEYSSIWAYVTTRNSMESLPHVLKVSPDTVKSLIGGNLPSAVQALDTEKAILFSQSVSLLTNSVPKGKLDERLAYVRSTYKTPSLKERVEKNVLERYLLSHDYTNKFDEGLAELTAVTEKYSLDGKYVAEYNKKRSAVKGAAFPDVALKDADGNAVDFNKFKGKYVYVDLWASWCVPCCREVPNLQQLEKELEGGNVEFVSISIDSKEAPWKKKMAELNMHGNQLFNSDAKLCEKLNVSGIPFFLIYDKEGKLYMYNAPRPSQGEGLKILLQELK